MKIKPVFFNSLLSQCLLFVDPDVEQDRLHTEKHPILDLSGQHVEHHPRHGNPDVEAIPVPRDHRWHVGGGARSRLCDFEGDISQVRHSNAHILQHGQLLAFRKVVVSTHTAAVDVASLASILIPHTHTHVTISAEQALILYQQPDGVQLPEESCVTQAVSQLDNEAADQRCQL